MIYPFRKTTGATTDLVKDYNIKDHYPDVNMNTPWTNISPYLRQAIRTYVMPYIGATIYDDIVDKLQNEDALTASQETFAEMLKDVCAHYCIMHMLPKKKTIIASMGAVSNIATEGTTGSNIWEFKTTLYSVMQDADRMMEEMLQYMQEQVEAADAYFVTNWKEADAYTTLSAGLFRQVGDFQEYHNIGKSLRTFKAMVPLMKEVEERVIIPIICQDQYDRLAEAIEENDATADEAKLLHLVRKVLAKYTVYEAAVGLPILSEQDGFRVISNVDAVDQRQYNSDVITSAIQGIREYSQRAGKTSEADLVQYLYDNADTFPLWEASDCNKLNSINPAASVYYNGPGAVML